MTSPRPIALVTGAHSGLGKFAASGLLDAGFDVVGTSRNTSGLDPRKGVSFRDLDVTSDDSVAKLIDGVVAQFGRIDVLVNNAGMGLAARPRRTRLGSSRNCSTSTSSA
jgi:NAD(P)-dependent dehydrogenase (short-subunit alcohol dehydrogenase family)